ncbi:MAG: ATP-dependent protease ATPase subunit HslU [Bdellovibrionales bacterium]|nr:ATP-dependent protease ATPase subunit HslU [Bdellovibrionales bacterium]
MGSEGVATVQESLTPREIVSELDRYIIGQDEAKRAVAIALRNRWRRQRVPAGIREEITPKNIIMIGPTGVGKTEISRRLAKLARAPFVKVEATKFTEVGYVGRDVESIIRDLVEVARRLVRKEQREFVREKASAAVEERLLNLLLPDSGADDSSSANTREKLRGLLRDGKLEERIVEVEISKQNSTHLEILGPPGMGELEGQLKDVFSNIMPKSKERRTLSVTEARGVLLDEAMDDLIDEDAVSREAVSRSEQSGIVFIDEIDKVCGSSERGKVPDVSREGVQRDLLPLVEGCTVSTKYGTIKTDHILFIASGAFHTAKPSDLMPEFQGRFPIRVELKSLLAPEFVRILTEPQNALTKQYEALLKTEGVTIQFAADALEALAQIAEDVNSQTEDIGARRLHTLLERVLESLSFKAPDQNGLAVYIDKAYVDEQLAEIARDRDLSRYIL